MNFSFSNRNLKHCQKLFMALDPEDSLFMTHYELAKETEYGTPQLWKEFLMDSRVAEYIRTEVQVYKEAQMRKLLKNVNDNERSVGAAQMLNALGKIVENDNKKEGELIVYSYVPVNERERHAPNVQINQKDLFI